MDFTPVAAAIADFENAEKDFEKLAQADTTAQSALTDAQSTAAATATAKADGKTTLGAKADALETAVETFKASL